jgi:F0F1-type ATP synthase membrane subunit b/b'
VYFSRADEEGHKSLVNAEQELIDAKQKLESIVHEAESEATQSQENSRDTFRAAALVR